VVAKLSLYSAYDNPPHQDLILAMLLKRFLKVETNVWENSEDGRPHFLAILGRFHSFSRESMPAYAGPLLTDQLMAPFPLIRAELAPMEVGGND
jgi:hypothetical protein